MVQKLKKIKSSSISRSKCHNIDAVTEKKSQLEHSVPTLATLRQDRLIQKQVDKRLKGLSNITQGTDQKVKSQRGGSVDIFVKNRVKWPHEFVLAGPSQERVSYNNLTALQWAAGFCHTMKEEKDLGVREHMLDYHDLLGR